MTGKFVITINYATVIVILPAVLLFVISVALFFREARLDRERFLENERLVDEHILKEVERFKKQMELRDRVR